MIKLICLHKIVGKYVHTYIHIFAIYMLHLFLLNFFKICARPTCRERNGRLFSLLFTNRYQLLRSNESLPPSSSLGYCHLGSLLAPGTTSCEFGFCFQPRVSRETCAPSWNSAASRFPEAWQGLKPPQGTWRQTWSPGERDSEVQGTDFFPWGEGLSIDNDPGYVRLRQNLRSPRRQQS